jgi:energy-coupling factor transporter ATP-binding protein EcfA2
MLTHLYIDNFKSLVDFHLPPKGDPNADLPKLITLVGVNGAGKTTLLQALSFLRQLMLGRVSDWLQQRDWKPSDLAWRGNNTIHPQHKARLTFSLTFQCHHLGTLRWSGQLDYKTLKCVKEQIFRDEAPVRIPNLAQNLPPLPLSAFQVLVKYESSIFSVISTSDTPAADAIKQFLTRTISLELLSPHAMRRRARASDELGTTGEKLSGFISQRSAQQRAEILQDLQRFYPHARGLRALSVAATAAPTSATCLTQPLPRRSQARPTPLTHSASTCRALTPSKRGCARRSR